mgnify:CR=1 FL=1
MFMSRKLKAVVLGLTAVCAAGLIAGCGGSQSASSGSGDKKNVKVGIVQLVEMIVEKFSPTLYSQLGIFLPLIAVNCAILGGSLFMQQKVDALEITSLWQSIVYGLGSGLGWWLAIVMMAAIREKTTYSQIPAALRGPGIAFIITGLMGIAFMIFSGIKL